VWKDDLLALHVQKYTTVCRLIGPSPFQVQFIVAESLFGTNVPEWIPGGIYYAFLNIEERFWRHLIVAYDDVPVIQVRSVE